MSAENPRYYKYYPQKVIDLGTMPFEGDFTTDDRIIQTTSNGFQKIYISNAAGTQFGSIVTKKVGKKTQQVWEPGVTIGPVTYEGTPMPVWFIYHGNGMCAVKLPNGEQPEPYVEPEEPETPTEE